MHICKIVYCKIDGHRLATFMCCYCLEHLFLKFICRIGVLGMTNITQLLVAQYPLIHPFLCAEGLLADLQKLGLKLIELTHCSEKKVQAILHGSLPLLIEMLCYTLLGNTYHPSVLQYFVYCPFSNHIRIFQE